MSREQQKTEMFKIIAPAAIAVWLASILVTREGVPAWVKASVSVAMGLFIVGLVAFLFLRQSGWLEIARRHPGDRSRPATWKTCRTAIMSSVPRDDPNYRRSKAVLVFIVRVDADERALHLSVLPVFAFLLPPISIPWTGMARAERFDAGGWMGAPADPGSVTARYDPGYRGAFLELELAEPKWFLQLPADLVGPVPALAGAPRAAG